MTDPQYWAGDDERDLDPDALCDECGAELYPEERAGERCRRCVQRSFENDLETPDPA